MLDNHDLFLITGQRELNHVKVDDHGVPKEIRAKVSPDYPGRRKVMNIALCGPPEDARGSGFSILPNRPDPDTSQMSCFLINPQNLRAANPWTVAEWSEAEDHEDNSLPDWEYALEFSTPAFEALLAGPQGHVYFVRCSAQGEPAIDRLSEASLAIEGELWSQLRNGLVAGSVSYAGHPDEPGRTVAALNITAVLPRKRHNSGREARRWST